MFSSIRARLWLSYAALIVAALGVVAIVLAVYLVRNPYLYRQTFVRLTAAQNLLVDAPRSASRLNAVAEALGVRVLLLDGSGTLIQDSNPVGAQFRTLPALLSGRALATVRDASGRLWFYTRARQADGTWLLVAAPRPKLLPALSLLTDELSRPLVQGGLIALVLSLLVAYLLARWIGDPLQQLVAAVQGVSAVGPGIAPASYQGPAPDTAGDVNLVAESGPKEVRELTQAFNAMLRRVEASQRSQRDFVANVSHELKTPLTSIQGFAQALLEGAAQSPEARTQAAQVIYDEAGRMHRLALDLLDLARLDAGTADLSLADVDMALVLRGVVDKFRPLAASAGVAMQATIADDLPLVRGDGDRLAQVFTNLLDNALKFTPRGGQVRLQAAEDGDEIEVAVQDTGQGIRPEDLPHVFDRFFQADAARSGGEKHGSGLGLAIAREITFAHRGRINARSAEGQGAAFYVRLPVASRPRG